MEDLINKISCNIIDISSNIINCINHFNNYISNDWVEFKTNFPLVNQKKYYKHIIFRNDFCELILIKWDKGTVSTIHKHPKNGCIMKLLKGNIREERFCDKEIYQVNNIKENSTSYMHDILGEHRIIALEESYSLHLYSPPNFYN